MRILSKDRCRLGESPLWDGSSKVFYWLDLLQPQLHRITSDLTDHEIFELPAPLQCMGLYHSGSLIGISSKQFVQIEFMDGSVRFNKIADIEISNDVAFNDGKCDAKGRFWSGTKACNHNDEIGGLYRFDLDVSIEIMDEDLIVSNGLGWNPENTLFYLVDTMKRVIYVHDFDLISGTIANKRVFVEFNSVNSPDNFLPDGLTVDNKGDVWVAIWGGSRLIRYDQDGQKCGQLELPTANITSCCFGGAELDTLFVTTSSVNGPNFANDLGVTGGAVFVFDSVGVRGILEPECKYPCL